MRKNLHLIGKLCLCASMITSSAAAATPIMAAELETGTWSLHGASLLKTEDNAAYVSFASGQKARIAFLSDTIFRIDVEEADAEFAEYPKAMSSTHTTKMTAKSEDEFKAEKLVKAEASTADGVITISGGEAVITIDQETSIMAAHKKDGTLLWKEAAPLSFDGTQTVQSLETGEDEYFYGGGQQNGFFSHKNRKILIENKSTWVSGGVSSPNPFYMSTNGYGAMRNTFQPGSYDFHSTALLEHDENRFDSYYFVGDGLKDVLEGYVELTGNPLLLPKYAFYQGNANCYNREGQSLIVDGIQRAKEYQDHDMPVGWFLPNDGYGCGYGKSTDADENISELREFVEKAKEYGFVSGLWTENDLDKLDREVANGGSQMIKTDVAWVGDGYSFGLNAVRQAFEGIENNSDNRGFVVSVDGWAGTQRYAGLWTGDQTGGNWEYIRFHIPTYIGASLSGNPNVGSDLDGIYGSGDVISTRDFQWKAFTPIEINMDGWTTGAEKNPWYHGDPYESINRMYLKLKSSFMPYTYTYAKEAHDTGTPMIRGLLLEYPEDPFTWTNQTQYEYLWGENLLVAPVYEDVQMDENGNDIRNNIYLPDENQVWIDFFSGKQYQGGQVLNSFDAPLWKLPLFVKNGAILPRDEENNSDLFRDKGGDRIYEVYPAGETEFTQYDDDGMTQDYKEGASSTTHITSSAPASQEKGTAVITVEKTSGSFDGMVNERGTQFIVNVSEKPEAVEASIGGASAALQEVTSREAFEAAESGVWFYDEAYNMNHYATEGSDFANVEMITGPKVFVKTHKTDTTENEVRLTVKGFINAQAAVINEADQEIKAEDVPLLTAEASDSVITLSREENEAHDYSLIIDGNTAAPYNNVTSPFRHDSLNPDEEHTYQLVASNTKFEQAGPVQRFTTAADPYKNVVNGITVQTNSQYGGNVGGYPAFYAVDGDESTLWYTNWDDPVTYSGTKWIIMDLHDAYELDQLEYFNNGTAQIKNHEIQVSLDGVNWKTVEQSVWERKAENRIFTDLSGARARYVKLISYDKHHNSCNEIHIYKKDGSSAFNPGSSQKNETITEADLTFLENYMGTSAAETGGAWMQSEPGDINYNNEIDAYDLAFTMSQRGLEPDNRRAGGKLSVSLDKTSLKAGETATLTVTGSGLKDIYAFGGRLTLGADTLSAVEITSALTGDAAEMKDFSKVQSGSKDYVLAASFDGAHAGLQGDHTLMTLNIRAKGDVNLDIQEFVPMVISTGLDCRLALGDSTVDLRTLENLVAAAAMDTSAYTADSQNVYNKALEAANAVLDNPEATQEELDQAALDILDAVHQLERKDLTRSGVLTVLTDWISEKAPEAGYTQANLDKLLAVVADAQSVALFEGDNPESVDAAIRELTEKLAGVPDAEGTDTASKILLQDFAASFVKDEAGSYTEDSLNALDAAGKTADFGKIADALCALEPVAHTDRAQLKTFLNMMDVLEPETAEWNDHLMEIQTSASAAHANENAGQEDLDAHTSRVHEALVSLLGEPAGRLRDALDTLVKNASALDLEHKTPASKSALEEALDQAKAALEDEAASQDELENAYTALKAAINGLQDQPEANKSDLGALIEKAEGINESLYTKDSVDALKKALDEAKAVFGNEAADQDQVDAAAESLQKAIDALEKNPEGTDKPENPEKPDEGNKPSKPGTEKPGNEKPGTEKPGSDKPGTTTKKPATSAATGSMAALFGTLSSAAMLLSLKRRNRK